MSSSPVDQVSDVTPEPVSSMSCCPWRGAIKTPLLLLLAAGIGFAGQQVWSKGGDLSSLKSSVHSLFAGGGASSCPLSASTESCCTAAATLASLSAESFTSGSTAPACCSGSGGQMTSSCCTSGGSEAVAEIEEPLSALQAENTATEL